MAAERTGFIDVVDVPGVIFSDTAYEDFAIYTETSNQGILIGTLQSNVSSISIRSNVTTINGTLNINGVSAMLLPKGTTLQRPAAPVLGQVRYNADINTFEGFGAGSTWGSLGGVKDTNQDTYISPESFPTSNDDILRFYNSNNETMRIMSTGRIGISNQAPSERLEISGGNAKFNSNLYVIQNLSVGKSNPSYPLDVYGNAAVDGSVTMTKYVLSRGIQVSTRNTNTYTTTTLPSGVVLGFSNDYNGAVFSIGSNTTANYFKFLASSNEVFRITGAGYIVVNTQTPTEYLHVQGNVYATNQHLGTSNDSASVPSFSFKEDSNTGIFHPSNDAIGFSTNGSEKMRIDSLGNVGVNTQTPTEYLHVQGNVYATNQHLGNSNDSAGVPSFTFKEDSNTGIFHASNDAIGFSTNGTEKMRITSIGNVGIGNSNPVYPLDVIGDLNFTGLLLKNGAPYIGSQWSNNAANVFLMGSNVGIGTTAPTTQLHVNGAITAYNPSGTGACPLLNLATNQGIGANPCIDFYNYSYGISPAEARISSLDDANYSAHLVFLTKTQGATGNGLSEKMRITSVGNVGVGTSSPSCALDVVGVVKARGFSTSASSTNYIISYNGTPNNLSYALPSGSGVLYFVRLYNGDPNFDATYLVSNAGSGYRITVLSQASYFRLTAFSISGTTATVTMTNSANISGYNGVDVLVSQIC